VRVGDWEIVLLERAYEWITVSAGERCLEHQERVKDGLKGRKKPETVNAEGAKGARTGGE
jgi:hypothetical protein